MKYLITGVFTAALLLMSQTGYTLDSRGARSCSVWQENRQDEKDGYPRDAETFQTWVIGYLSGIVAGSGMDFLAGTDNEVVFDMVDAYCNANPQLNLAGAGTHVARRLMDDKKIVNRGTLP